jgi:hypothetical protein
MLKIERDLSDQPYIQWEQAPGKEKRAWIQRKADPEKNWANAPRYLNVVRCADGRPGGNPTDFPIFSDLSDEQVLISFVSAVSSITGCKLM